MFANSFSERPLWWTDAAPVSFSITEQSRRADVLVVGSGYAGLSCAHQLASSGLKVTVVDAQKIGEGASTRNAGFLSGRAGISKQINLEALVGAEHASKLFEEADAAYSFLQDLVHKQQIDCHLEARGRFVGAHTPAAFDKLAAKMAEYQRDGNQAFHMVPRSEQHQYVDSDYWYGGMFTEAGGSIHPSRYHQGLLELCLQSGVRLVSENRVFAIHDQGSVKRVETEQGDFEATEVVVATNGYTDQLSPWLLRRLVRISSTIAASEIIGPERVAAILPRLCPVIDTKRVICFARPSPDYQRILFGGRGRFADLNARQIATILHAQLSAMFPQMADIKVTHAWSGYMAMTFDFMPKMGEHKGVHHAIGCNAGCGIVMMSWLGRQVANKILGSEKHTSAFEGLKFQSRFGYSGNPWFLPVIGNWWRLRDWLEITSARLVHPR
ncbi:MAG: FAD-binding oxidoreductase [Pseudomonadota bacterium]